MNDHESLMALIKQRPSIHLLCSGCYLQSPLKLSEEYAFIPLRPMDFTNQVNWLADYALNCGAIVDIPSKKSLHQQGQKANPCVAIVATISNWTTPEDAENTSAATLERLISILSSITGNHAEAFGYVILGPDESFYRLVPPSMTKRTRLGFGNTEDDIRISAVSILTKAQSDERFAFALSLVHDANREHNVKFRIARYYNCLEALAYQLKKKSEGSRDAIRALLGLHKGRTGQFSTKNRVYDYDVVLGAGILRDHLFHGSPLDFKKAKQCEKDTFDLMLEHPDVVAKDLQSRVELEIAKWSNNASNGQIK